MSNAWKPPHHEIEEWCYSLVFECECLEQYMLDNFEGGNDLRTLGFKVQGLRF
jgi:hypothetical protein